ncbi:dihydroneopterin aldolase [Actibacterium sp. 188UL27-1]|uniref:dihydroneopterin aldolase n=1 Tax=Actibacterium sp. 188UL27-1 TaxID=2786961 RepID=UPI001958BBD1|nr:dihydroneopterin aldolase [Actibacterium sp. 188UL27-1]MBM7068193.1 dihydroneopterin aldolase [Actibacterium sp. 188UL27-1]
MGMNTVLPADRIRDRISVRDYVLEVEIGAFQAERGTTQRIRLNVEVEVARSDEPVLDDVDRILSYDTITQAIDAALAAERLNLLETLAERIADLLLPEPRARRVHIRIEKLDRGPFALGVDITRDRQMAARVAVDRPAPIVVHLAQAAIDDTRLPGWLDQIERLGRPVILTVVSHDLELPPAAITPARRRIALLAIEQNAWVLAGRDPRCVVVSTRTEIDWAMENGQMTVWAPSKMVLDAVERPDTASQDATALALWFAEVVDACRVLMLGETAVEGGEAVALADQLAL